MREQMNKTTALKFMGSVAILVGILSACRTSSTRVPAINVDKPRIIFGADPENLLPCGTFEEMRLLQPADATTSFMSTATPAANPNPPTPGVAPLEDRVGFPKDFATDFKLLMVFDRPDRKLARAICGNDIAMQRKAGEPFAYGSVLLMISYSAKLDAAGEPVPDENGHYIRENFVAYHVMRKEEGFGEAYGEARAGEWEFVAFKEDGSTYDTRPENSNFCAACHRDEGGESIDYVFRMNMATGGEADVASPPVGENEVSIYLYDFHEPQMTIKAGTTVTWINNDQAEHFVKAAVKESNGKIKLDQDVLFESEILSSATIEPGASFSFTFREPGEYYYLCSNHADMVGMITVTK